MNQPSTGTHPLLGDGKRARILQSLLLSLVMTPFLLLSESTRRIVSLEATLAAIVLGIFFGVVAAIGLADIDFQDANSMTVSIVAIVCILLATVVVWLILPHRYMGTFTQFIVTFIWAMPITELVYHRLWAPEPI